MLRTFSIIGTIECDDPSVLQRMKDAYDDGTGVFNSIDPVPEHFPRLTPMEQRDWMLEHWGTVNDVTATNGLGRIFRFSAPNTLVIDIGTVVGEPEPIIDWLFQWHGCDIHLRIAAHAGVRESGTVFFVNGIRCDLSVAVDEAPPPAVDGEPAAPPPLPTPALAAGVPPTAENQAPSTASFRTSPTTVGRVAADPQQ